MLSFKFKSFDHSNSNQIKSNQIIQSFKFKSFNNDETYSLDMLATGYYMRVASQ